jgi:hypothetical protein
MVMQRYLLPTQGNRISELGWHLVFASGRKFAAAGQTGPVVLFLQPSKGGRRPNPSG